MKVHFLTENALEALRTNLRGNLRHYADATNDWIYDYFGSDNPFMEFKLEFPSFKLNYNENDDTGTIDIKNAIILYSAMKSLTDTEATDERLWSGMCHYDFWDFLQVRYKVNNPRELIETNVKTRYFFAHGKRRSLFTNPLAKLWWCGRLTYDESRSDPFELTKYVDKYFSSASVPLFSNNYMANTQISVGLLSALKKLEENGYDMTHRKQKLLEATKYLNVLGGTYILDYFTSEEIEEKVIKYMKSIKCATYNSSELKTLSLV